MGYNKIILVFLGIFLAACSGIRNSMTFFPDQKSEISKDQIPAYVIEKEIKTSDDETLQAFYFKITEPNNESLVIYLHGNAGNLYGRFEYAKQLYEMNHNVLLISYRGYAKSTGKPSEEGIYLDGEAAVTFAIETLGFQEENITIFGRSLGTTVAINASQKRNFKGVVLVTPLTSGKEMAVAMELGSLTSVAGESYNSIAKINNLIAPILILHGTIDNVIPFDMGKDLYDTYNGTKKLITIDGGNHNDLQDISPTEFWDGIEDFIN
ncbi:MAG: alpha/beta hydrolase [Flavobacteriales bacterium]|nr:alpha/beta hydrolase [Flavobacteriales bacterium]